MRRAIVPWGSVLANEITSKPCSFVSLHASSTIFLSSTVFGPRKPAEAVMMTLDLHHSIRNFARSSSDLPLCLPTLPKIDRGRCRPMCHSKYVAPQSIPMPEKLVLAIGVTSTQET